MKAEQCAKLLLKQDRILLVTHNNPDGDTAASASALCSALRRQGKTAFLYPNPQLGARLRAYAEQFFAPADFTPAYTVTVDVATEKMYARGFEGKVDLAIDHHPTNSHYAKAECIDDRRAACGEIVLQIIKAMGGVTFTLTNAAPFIDLRLASIDFAVFSKSFFASPIVPSR